MKVDTNSIKTGNLYQLLVGSVLPRPIAWVSSRSEKGVDNLAPFSFFTVASVQPPVLCFTPLVRQFEGEPNLKDTVQNITETKDFVVHVVNRDLAEAMNASCGEYSPEVDEFEIAGLEKIEADCVRASRVAAAPIAMECRLRELIRFGDQSMAGCLVLGDILRLHLDDEIMREGKIDTELLQPIARLAGNGYTDAKEVFTLQRPVVE